MIRLGPVELDAPDEWDMELDVALRAPAVEGYRANVRLTVRTGDDSVTLASLAQLYESQLATAGQVQRESKRDALVRGADEALTVTFSVVLAKETRAQHRVVFARRGTTFVTAGGSTRADGPQLELQAVEKALAGLRVLA